MFHFTFHMICLFSDQFYLKLYPKRLEILFNQLCSLQESSGEDDNIQSNVNNHHNTDESESQNIENRPTEPKTAITSDESHNSSDLEEGHNEVSITFFPDDVSNRIMCASASHSNSNVDDDDVNERSLVITLDERSSRVKTRRPLTRKFQSQNNKEKPQPEADRLQPQLKKVQTKKPLAKSR